MTKSLSNRITVTGYVTPRQFGPFAMPVPAQNSCLREYAASMDYIYALPQCEHIFPDCFMQLFTTLNSAPENGHIAMYSFHMMPKAAKDIEKLLELLEEKHLTFHYVLEKKTIKNTAEFRAMARILKIADIARHNDVLRQTLSVPA